MGYWNAWKWQTIDVVVDGTPKRWAFERRRRAKPKCNNGI
jgi:hypothetical protein